LAAACHGRHRFRDELLILTLFQTGVRISEALSLTPRHIGTQERGAVLDLLGKGGKSRLAAWPIASRASPSTEHWGWMTASSRSTAGGPGRSLKKPPRGLE
jgi:site-specific recombinase XerD